MWRGVGWGVGGGRKNPSENILCPPSAGKPANAALAVRLEVRAALTSAMLAALTIVEQTLHTRHRPPPGVRHVEVPQWLVSARDDALRHANVCENWRQAGKGAYSHTAALRALCEVHTSDHLENVQQNVADGRRLDTYCAPGSWEAMLDGTSAYTPAIFFLHVYLSVCLLLRRRVHTRCQSLRRGGSLRGVDVD